MLRDPFKIKPFLTLLNHEIHIKVIQRGNVKSLKGRNVAQPKVSFLLFNNFLSLGRSHSFSFLASNCSFTWICLGLSIAWNTHEMARKQAMCSESYTLIPGKADQPTLYRSAVGHNSLGNHVMLEDKIDPSSSGQLFESVFWRRHWMFIKFALNYRIIFQKFFSGEN